MPLLLASAVCISGAAATPTTANAATSANTVSVIFVFMVLYLTQTGIYRILHFLQGNFFFLKNSHRQADNIAINPLNMEFVPSIPSFSH